MIVRLSGELSDLTETGAVVERDGLAYEVLVPSYALAELAAQRGRTVTLHTLEFYESAGPGGNLTPRLVGFPHPEERAFFQKYTTVKGIGVRKALKTLAEPVARIASYIESGEVKHLAQLPGIGKRAADQIVAELRGKVGAFAFAAHEPPAAVKQAFSDEQRDAIEVLVAWGDSRPEAERWIARAGQLHNDLSGPDDWVRAAYRVKAGHA